MAGVSTATVSNVLNKTGSVGRTTTQRVEATIIATQWKPDENAQRLARVAVGKGTRRLAERSHF